MIDVPFIGKLNTVFIIAIGFGMGIILICMVFNIINAFQCIKMRKRPGLTPTLLPALYSTALQLRVIALFMTGHKLPGGTVLLHHVPGSAACNVLKRATYQSGGKEAPDW